MKAEASLLCREGATAAWAAGFFLFENSEFFGKGSTPFPILAFDENGKGGLASWLAPEQKINMMGLTPA
jgi:hypothetical protein